MKILVTGGAGYIGSHVVDKLVDEDHEVTVLDNLSTGRIKNLALSTSRIQFVEGDIMDERLINDLVNKHKFVFHLAAAVGVGNIMLDPLQSMITNVRGTENVLSACSRNSVKVLLASTSEIYGKTTKLPMSENDDRVLGSTSIARWSYSTAKAIDEHLALAYGLAGMPVVIARYFNSYGPRILETGYGSVIANFIRQAKEGSPLTVYGDGLQSRCFTYISDTINGTILAALTSQAEGNAFNIGNNSEITILELAQLIIELTGSKSTIQFISYADRFGPSFEDTKRRVPDMEKSGSLLGYRPSVVLEKGLELTISRWDESLL